MKTWISSGITTYKTGHKYYVPKHCISLSRTLKPERAGHKTHDTRFTYVLKSTVKNCLLFHNFVNRKLLISLMNTVSKSSVPTVVNRKLLISLMNTVSKSSVPAVVNRKFPSLCSCYREFCYNFSPFGVTKFCFLLRELLITHGFSKVCQICWT